MSNVAAALLGFGVAELCSGHYDGDPALVNVKGRIGKYNVHVHHWLIFLIILPIYISAANNSVPFVIFAMIGIVAHGFTYTDWHRVIYV
jgi:hypothetical protein